MRNLYPKNKGKVYPSPSSSTIPNSSSSSPSRDVLSVLKLLPAAILALASVLSLEDREVLAYMITRSMKTTTSPSSMIEEKKKCQKSSNNTHKPPIFDCGCFDCYRSYWFRWDSSPNRELIHHVIEAFEDHLNNGELSKKNPGRGKKKDRMSRRRVIEKPGADRPDKERFVEAETLEMELKSEKADPLPEGDAFAVIVSGRAEEEDEEEQVRKEEEEEEEECVEGEVKCTNKRNTAAEGMEAEGQVWAATGGEHHHHHHHHKGLARKVIPDVLGLLNSRLWSLWSPSI